MKKLTQSFNKLPYTYFVLTFFGFFFWEYLLPIINSLNYAQQNGLMLTELLAHRQILKHFIRLPVYTLIYAFGLYYIAKGKKIAYTSMRWFLLAHLIFKPLSGLFLIGIAARANLLAKFPIMSLAFLGVVVGMYLLFLQYLSHYWQTATHDTE